MLPWLLDDLHKYTLYCILNSLQLEEGFNISLNHHNGDYLVFLAISISLNLTGFFFASFN